MRSIVLSVLTVAALLTVAAHAEAAWNPSTSAYTSSITSVRNAMSAYYGTGASASSMPAKAQRYLQKADGRLQRAAAALGSNPGWKEIRKSLKQLRKAAWYMEKAGRKASTVTGFQTFLYQATTGALPVLYGHSRTFAVGAATYVVQNSSSARATRKLLRAGAKTTKAQRLAGATPPKFSRAIDKNRDAIRILGGAGLL